MKWWLCEINLPKIDMRTFLEIPYQLKSDRQASFELITQLVYRQFDKPVLKVTSVLIV